VLRRRNRTVLPGINILPAHQEYSTICGGIQRAAETRNGALAGLRMERSLRKICFCGALKVEGQAAADFTLVLGEHQY